MGRHRRGCPKHPNRCCFYCKAHFVNRWQTVAHEVFCAANPSCTASHAECVACGDAKQCLLFPCGEHSYCDACILQMVRNGLKDRSLLPLRCCKTYVEAGDRVDLAIGQMLLEGQRYPYHETMMLRTGTTVMYCPRVTCGVLIILDGLLSLEAVQATRHGVQADLELGDSHQLQNVGPVGCPKCEQALCFCCRSEWHQGMSCKQYQFSVSRTADDITRFCRKMNWMRCFECGHVIENKNWLQSYYLCLWSTVLLLVWVQVGYLPVPDI